MCSIYKAIFICMHRTACSDSHFPSVHLCMQKLGGPGADTSVLAIYIYIHPAQATAPVHPALYLALYAVHTSRDVFTTPSPCYSCPARERVGSGDETSYSYCKRRLVSCPDPPLHVRERGSGVLSDFSCHSSPI